jgi:hypothetical protein
MNAPAKTTFHTFNPDVVIHHLSKNDWAGCWDYLQSLLESFTMSINAELNIALQNEMEDEERKKHVSDFGALAGELILALLGDPDCKIPDKNFMGLIFCHETLHSLFYLYGSADTDALVGGILGGKGKLSDIQQKRLLLLLSLRTDLDIVDILRHVDSKYRIPALASYFSHSKIFEKKVHENKKKLYALRREMEKADSEDRAMSAAFSAFFRCSYLDMPDKHDLKESINVAVKKYLSRSDKEFRRIQNSPRKGIDGIEIDPQKPNLAVLLEVYAKEHAMNRSWGEWIKSLGGEFNVMVLAREGIRDPSLKSDYRNVVTFNSIGDLVQICHDFAPDVLMMPSVGMYYLCVAAANMRLASLQIMGLGHPATSRSAAIDFVYGQSKLYTPEAFPGDKYIADDSPYRFIPVLTREEALCALPGSLRGRGGEDALQVSVVGATQKLAAPFVDLLEEIERESPFKIHFSFHMDAAGINSLYVQKSLGGRFKNMTFYGRQPYRKYFDSLKSADIVLNPFPFGHTNTVIDTLLLGKPCVGLEGIEPSSRTESYVLDIVGLADQFVAKSREDYKEKFFGLARKIRAGQTEFFDRGEMYDLLYGAKQMGDFGKVVRWIYDNQKKLKASPEKMFSAFERVE